MEMKVLPPIVLMLVLTALVVGVGVLIFDKFGDTVKIDTPLTNNENDTVTLATGIVTLSNDEIVSLQGCYDVENMTNLGTTLCNVTDSEAGKLVTSLAQKPRHVYVNYTYQRDSITTTSLASSATAVGAVSNSWMTLIVTILILSVILFFVLRSFAFGRR